MKKFKYLGMTFEPVETLSDNDGDFFAISKRISDEGLTPNGYNWQEFYNKAIKSDANNAEIDLFKHKDYIVIPCEKCLFVYRMA